MVRRGWCRAEGQPSRGDRESLYLEGSARKTDGPARHQSRRSLEAFDAPEQASGKRGVLQKIGLPERKDLRTLIDTLESAFRFRHGFDRCNPELLRTGSVERDAHFLPAILHSQQGSRQDSRKAQVLGARGGLEKAVGLGRSKE